MPSYITLCLLIHHSLPINYFYLFFLNMNFTIQTYKVQSFYCFTIIPSLTKYLFMIALPQIQGTYVAYRLIILIIRKIHRLPSCIRLFLIFKINYLFDDEYSLACFCCFKEQHQLQGHPKGKNGRPLQARAITFNHYYFVRYPYDSFGSF